ncbi:MAG: endonuclease [Flavobacteriales bacterium CG18_big_fil_WC_8_21_14_2_50_32_9]|nr:MAG: endonuclease [Flavobacteriales bacterium CG18_big_fil_WC_8_21_14_2_50_32_9]
MQHNYFVYITTNPNKTTLYIGVTNDLRKRMFEHQEDKGTLKSFAGKYYCYNLIYYEHFEQIEHAIDREKQLKKWSRKKKEQLIETLNPNWIFLNDEIFRS